MKSLSLLLFWAIYLPAVCQSSSVWSDRINTLKKEIVAQPTQSNCDSLHLLVSEHYSELTTSERSNIRTTLEKQAKWADAKLCSKSEQGTKITIKGRILDEHKKPVANAHLSIYHADNNGNYAPSDGLLKKMSEGDPRLFGFVTTDKWGNYAFQTVRPASYPNKYNGRTIPQHIHINISATRFRTRAVQMTFDDDPQMSDVYWQNWAKQQNYPVVKLFFDKSGDLNAIYDLLMNS